MLELLRFSLNLWCIKLILLWIFQGLFRAIPLVNLLKHLIDHLEVPCYYQRLDISIYFDFKIGQLLCEDIPVVKFTRRGTNLLQFVQSFEYNILLILTL